MPNNRELTGQQLYELKWFCNNVVGVRKDFYSVKGSVDKFDERLTRLEKTCAAIDKFLKDRGDEGVRGHPDPMWDKVDL